MSVLHKNQDFRVTAVFDEGGRCTVVIRDQPGHAAACDAVATMLKKTPLNNNGAFKITRCKPLLADTTARVLVEGALVALAAVAIPVVGFWHLGQILAG